jgi:division protein CdvB (Snf7/Vps24/ESCRT-III family)
VSVVVNDSGGGFNKILKLFTDITSWGSKRTLKKSLLEIVIKLREYKDMLEETMGRLRSRHDDLFRSAITSYVKGDKAKASIYVNELAEIRKIITNIYTSVLALERAILRIETIKEVSNINIALGSVLAILNALKGQVSNVVPEVATGIEVLTSEIRNLITSTTGTTVSQDKLLDMSTEAQKILQEVKEIAEAKMSKSLPQIPEELLRTTNVTDNLKTVVTVTTQTSDNKIGSKDVKNSRMTKESLEDKVLEYIITHGGFIDVSDAAKKFNVSKEEIIQILKILKEKNKIIF